MNNDELHKPNVDDPTVYILSGASPVSKELLIKKYPKVFHKGLVSRQVSTAFGSI